MAGHLALARRLAKWKGTIGAFSRMLDREGVPYLSFSKVTCVEFCSYRYLLEYVQLRRPTPTPDYFLKGQAFHEAVARLYRIVSRRRLPDEAALLARLTKRVKWQSADLNNAVRLAIQNVYCGWDVIGVEEPFVLCVGRRLPPCVGVVDLILRRGSTFAVVDHKTAKKFNGADELQLALYREYARRRYEARRCLTIVDEYRWVPDLTRIRKPAFQRTPIRIDRSTWSQAKRRLANAHEAIREIEANRDAVADGECFLCPFKPMCPRASSQYSWW